MSPHPRIAELQRRIDADPASIAFAQLAEEYRREGEYEAAVRVCRAGLSQYPSYLSARVTLGRALTRLGRIDEARVELARVLEAAPDNIAARRAMEETALGHSPATPAPQAAVDPALVHLEAWLQAILRDRAERTMDDAAR